MPSFKGKKDGSWVEASAVYGKSSGAWLYGKSAWVKKDGTWQRAWTDCRKFDESGGQDWSSSSTVYTDTTGCDGCGTKSKTVVTYTKTGCPDDVRDPGYGACSGSWTVYYVDYVTIPVTGGTYGYVTGSIWGWLYSDSAGNAIYTCGGGSNLLGPGNVDSCSAGGYRVTGTDQCITPSY